jgi:glycerol-3-phosphate cytidylyltransferase
MTRYKIGYTTGVFDMFHIGHLNLLRNAKALCERLIVGVSTDDVVRHYKNKTPVIPFAERIEIVRAIRHVDEAVPQENLDKFEAWRHLNYTALIHGDDWRGSKLYQDYEAKLRQVGVAVDFVKHTDGVSSTELSRKIQDMGL